MLYTYYICVYISYDDGMGESRGEGGRRWNEYKWETLCTCMKLSKNKLKRIKNRIHILCCHGEEGKQWARTRRDKKGQWGRGSNLSRCICVKNAKREANCFRYQSIPVIKRPDQKQQVFGLFIQCTGEQLLLQLYPDPVVFGTLALWYIIIDLDCQLDSTADSQKGLVSHTSRVSLWGHVQRWLTYAWGNPPRMRATALLVRLGVIEKGKWVKADQGGCSLSRCLSQVMKLLLYTRPASRYPEVHRTKCRWDLSLENISWMILLD